MKPFDKRRLKAFLKDELEAVGEYKEMAKIMQKAGYPTYSQWFQEMARDEKEHANMISEIITLEEQRKIHG